ncbi:STE3-domain-containing protein [Russula earlei]|uniref:STE3-domain-containing protein n=1 Tax=Russula earlei TaxID=71964 RepID=A0ACC0UFQ3_9AGAM|nr:STE3-domain-containing protein [Russula earlei]
MAPPNLVYTVFSFIGFVMCAIPLYWHLEAWNVGTCLYMIWTGLGCLIQCVNSIAWNKNTTNKAPFWCDISIHVQLGLNVAISACSLCINRRLYKIATAKTVVVTSSEKRRAVIIDLFIGFGIPILQIIVAYVVSMHRYIIFEDFGPCYFLGNMPPTFVLFSAWPLAIGCVSFFYCSMSIYNLYMRGRQLNQISSVINRSRYFRLMALASIDMFASIPLSLYILVRNAQLGIDPWISWSDTHRNYSQVPQVSASHWKNHKDTANSLEMYRWLLVACAFVFFAFFGFADEACQRYHLAYTSLAHRISSLTSSRTSQEPSLVNLTYPHMKNKRGIKAPVGKPDARKLDPTISFAGQSSILSTSFPGYDLEANSKIEQYSLHDSVGSSSADNLELVLEGQSSEPVAAAPVTDPGSIPLASDLADTSRPTICGYSSRTADTV